MKKRFELKQVSKYYSKKSIRGKNYFFPALDSLDLTIHDGVINSIIGRSGCGKSTLARIIMGLEDFDQGEIYYQSHRLSMVKKKEFRRKNQIMFQNPYLSVNPCFKINKIISEPLVIDRRKKSEITDKVGSLLEILEISKYLLNKYPSELSAGQLQRIVLARALVLEPEFLVLDEPFSALDEIMAARLILQFKEIFRKLNIGVLFVSHRLERVRLLADFVAVMKQGRIIFQGKQTDYFSSPKEF